MTETPGLQKAEMFTILLFTGNVFWQLLYIIYIIDAEAPILWSPDVKCQLIGKDPDAGKDWGQEEKGMTEDGMVAYKQLKQFYLHHNLLHI